MKCLDNLLKKYKVLILDDIESNNIIVQGYLDELNIVKSFKYLNPMDAFKSTKNRKYDLMIVDIQMPIMDGYEFVFKVKNDENNKNNDTPIIFLTGIYNSDVDRMKGYNMGSIDYILKPIKIDEFLCKVKTYLENGNKDEHFFNIKTNNIKNIIK